MGLSNSDYIAISAIVLSFATFIFTYYRTKKIGPKIELFGPEFDNDGLIQDDRLFFISFNIYGENLGDKTTELIVDPKIIAYDANDTALCSNEDVTLYQYNYKKSIGIPTTKPLILTFDFNLPLPAQPWKSAKIKFNAYYYKRKRFAKFYEIRKKNVRKKVYLKRDEFTIFKK